MFDRGIHGEWGIKKFFDSVNILRRVNIGVRDKNIRQMLFKSFGFIQISEIAMLPSGFLIGVFGAIVLQTRFVALHRLPSIGERFFK